METKENETLKALRDAVILIPSLEPDERLPAYIQKLTESGFGHVVVVDDGSSAPYQEIFSRIESIAPQVIVLHHDVNHGKGVALKTGYKWIQENLPEISGVITADADGQHTVPDCVHLAEELEKGKRALYLGARDFSLPNVPPKSRTGNRFTSGLFFLMYGQWLQDTQTGLRAFRKEDLQMMIDVEGDRFEYEMNVLIACVRQKLPIISITIETVYENENKGTHYHPFRDSMRIFRVIVRGFVKFMGVSLLCFLVDQLLFNLLRSWLFPLMGLHLELELPLGLEVDNTSLANYTARLFSAILNFRLNRELVFKVKGSKGTAWRYAVTCVAIIILSTLGIKALGLLGMKPWLAKLICDFLLYFVSYQVQQRWVFSKSEDKQQ
jgi:dolichol-phosphate mannosyltransferase